ncbi:hypothetical protein [Hyalangium sp.]|uniref:hypothetical protein n=1 Tax=Hyalangium sp. TaxID=2028555 RepID=UPI002D640FA6|nr:hypothetical protein [Hyalangium sp.]HYH98791.1 hypothetical protein [Hyalangium sp.]
MSHPRSALPTYYRVELAPEAWREVGCVPAAEFQVLQDVIELLAVEGTPYEQGEGPYSITVAGFELQYTRDEAARNLTLHRVARALRKPEEAA